MKMLTRKILVLILFSIPLVIIGDLSAGRAFSSEGGKGGAQLWGENCARCHNLRSPTTFSDQQWEIVVNHMRARANLTGEEARKILKFLKSAN